MRDFRLIDFKPAMVAAILRAEGPKTQTRRCLKVAPVAELSLYFLDDGVSGAGFSLPGGEYAEVRYRYPLGCVLAVRESWALPAHLDKLRGTEIPVTAWPCALTLSQCPNGFPAGYGRVRAARFMPLWAASLFLPVEDHRVERVQAISEGDAAAEGLISHGTGYARGYQTELFGCIYYTAARAFEALWTSIHGDDPVKCWRANPWVEAIAFARPSAHVHAELARQAFELAHERKKKRSL